MRVPSIIAAHHVTVPCSTRTWQHRQRDHAKKFCSANTRLCLPRMLWSCNDLATIKHSSKMCAIIIHVYPPHHQHALNLRNTWLPAVAGAHCITVHVCPDTPSSWQLASYVHQCMQERRCSYPVRHSNAKCIPPACSTWAHARRVAGTAGVVTGPL